MSNVIKFGDYNNKNYSNSKDLISFFDKYKGRIEKFIDSNDLSEDPTFMKQYDNFNNIYNEIKNDKKWINDSKIQKMLDIEKRILLDNKDETEAFNEVNEYNTYALFLVFITCIDITKGKIVDCDEDYIRLIVCALTTASDINISKYKPILNTLMNDNIKELINLDEERALCDIEDVIQMTSEGRDISNIISIFNESNSYEIPNIDNKMLTIDRIHDYYINQLNIFFIDHVDDETYSTIDMITMLNHMDLDNKNMYVKLVYELKEKDLSMLEQIHFIKDLTEVFMYLFVDNDINISFENVKNIVALKYLNNTSIEQTIEDLKLNINGGMKQ